MTPLGKQLVRWGCAALLAGLSSSPAAQLLDRGWYFGAAVGRAHYGLPAAIVLESDSSSSSHRFLAGYRFNRHVSVEGAYIDFGEARRVLGWPEGILGICIIEAISPCNGNVRESTSATAHTLSVLGTIPVMDRIGVFGKLGIASVEATRTVAQYISASARDARTRPVYGIGIRYELTSSLGLRAEWETIRKAYSSGPASHVDVQAFAFGLTLQF